MKSTNDSLGRTVMIAVIAGVLFAGFLALTPRLTAGSQTDDQVGPAAVDAAGLVETAVSEPIVAVPGAAFDGFDGGDPYVEQEADDETDWSDDESSDDESSDDDWSDDEDWDDDEWDDDGDSDDEDECDGSSCECECVCLCTSDDRDSDDDDWNEDWDDEDDEEPVFDGSLDLTVEVFGPADGKESVILNDYDMARFQITVDNDGSEELWGLFVYLEGYGAVECDTSHLNAGDRVDCEAYDMVYSGTDTAEVWANAWTSEHQVGVEVAYDYYVSH